jgi:oligoendopeptidase F
MKIQKNPRTYISPELNIKSFEELLPYLNELSSREINSKEAFLTWLSDKSELDAVLEEDQAWRYIKMSIDTKNKDHADSYNFFVTEIQPKLAPFDDLLNNKLSENAFKKNLENEEAYKIYFRAIDVQLRLFKEENIALEAELSEEAQKYGAIAAAQTIQHGEKTLTMQQAAQFLKDQDQELRKTIFVSMAERRNLDQEALDDLFTSLIQKRHQLALNAGFENYSTYKFSELGRFDYTKKDCLDFHEAIKTLIVPIVKQIQKKKLELFKKDKFKPWDLEVDPLGKAALSPFKSGKEMLDGTIAVFDKIDPYFGSCLRTMEAMGHLDLESKEGKAPGGYNYPLYEIGVPFIFMNAVGAQRDLVTMVHEGGHAVHSFLSRDLKLTSFKNVPSEVAELASMSMELLSMKYWDAFYSNPEELNRAKREQLEGILKILPWIAQIDAFQHWVYENINHTKEERKAYLLKLSSDYGTGLTDWTGYEDQVTYSWQRQLHLFEVPFYYIEYGIAQLGALGIWKNSQANYQETITNYKDALSLGYTTSIPKIYATAKIKFDFSSHYLKELVDFVQEELGKL